MQRGESLVTPGPLARRLPFFYGWVVLGVATLGIFMSGPAQTYGVSVFITPMTADLGWSRSVVAGAFSAASIVAGLSMLIFGRVLDRVGSRRIVPVLVVLYGLACWGMAAVASPLALLLGFTALRLTGQAALSLACSTLAALWFVRRRGRAMSITVLGMALSNAVVPLALNAFVTQLGWRAAWLLTGAIVWAVLLAPAVLLIRDRPEAVGLVPDGATAPTATATRATAVEYTWTFQQALRTRTFWLLIAATVVPGTVMTGLFFHQVAYFASRGLSSELAASAFSVYAVAFAAMTFVVGFVLERAPERHVLIGGLLLLPLSVLLLLTATTPLQALLHAGLLGIVLGTNSTTSAVLWAAYYGRQHLGSIRGAALAAIVISAATGPLILSVPYDLTGRYTYGLWLMIALPLVGALAAALAGPPGPPPQTDVPTS